MGIVVLTEQPWNGCSPSLLVLAAAAVGAWWWFVYRKKTPAVVAAAAPPPIDSSNRLPTRAVPAFQHVQLVFPKDSNRGAERKARHHGVGLP